MTRTKAKEMGLKKYFGTPCKRGHEGWRYTSTGLCVRCKAMYQTGLHKYVSPIWKKIEEEVHAHDVDAVRDYCRKLREHRIAQILSQGNP